VRVRVTQARDNAGRARKVDGAQVHALGMARRDLGVGADVLDRPVQGDHNGAVGHPARVLQPLPAQREGVALVRNGHQHRSVPHKEPVPRSGGARRGGHFF
jgi:hypothetical protein